MRSPILISSILLAALSSIAVATDKLEWTFSNARVIIAAKGAEASRVESFEPHKAIESPLTLSTKETLKMSMIIKAGPDLSIPHQAYLYMRQEETGLETIYPFNLVEESAKARLEISQKDIPAAFVASSSPLSLSVVISCFTPTVKGLATKIGNLQLDPDAQSKAAAVKALGNPVRYEKLPEIRHIFRPDPKSPPKIITLAFLIGVLASLVGLFGTWAALSANISALPQALKAAPVSHPLFFGSIIAFESIFFMYYLKWNLFQALLAIGCVAPVGFLSGSKALTELRERRLKVEVTAPKK